MRHLLITSLFLGCATFSMAQRSHFNNGDNWRNHQMELQFGIGATQFLGDLGGADQAGTNWGLKDIDWPMTMPQVHVGFRYRFLKWLATTSMVSGGLIAGDDGQTTYTDRAGRGLSFRSPIVEVSQRIEVIPWSHEDMGRRHKVKGVRGQLNLSFAIYSWTGISGFYFNPQRKFNNKWENLQPRNTEGQSDSTDNRPYMRIQPAIPFGVGFKWGITPTWKMSVEAMYQLTFTDYMDDVSIRGNASKNDSYYFLTVSFIKNFSMAPSGKVKWKIQRGTRSKGF